MIIFEQKLYKSLYLQLEPDCDDNKLGENKIYNKYYNLSVLILY